MRNDYVVYIHKNILNGKVYVGQTCNLSERREKIRNKALGRKMPKDTRCKISLNHSKSNLLKINGEVGSIRYWALKIGKSHSALSYRLKTHGIDNLKKYIEQRIKLV